MPIASLFLLTLIKRNTQNVLFIISKISTLTLTPEKNKIKLTLNHHNI